MKDYRSVIELLESRKAAELFTRLYGGCESATQDQILRYKHLTAQYVKLFNGEDIRLFSSSGRTEIGGNHTDHNGGWVLSAGVHLDSIAAVSKTDSNLIRVYSEGYSRPFNVDINRLDPKKDERGTTSALIRGVAARFKELGYKSGGFNAFISSKVGVGSGLSSSASIEVLLGTILNILYNEGTIPKLKIAKIGQYAENVYFDKPCGLMDQITCAFGGVISIDFSDFDFPTISSINFNFSDTGYTLLVVDTGTGHADLGEDYAAIPREMKSISTLLGKRTCRGITLRELEKNIAFLRSKASDRAVLRAYHFITENERVKKEVKALKDGDFDGFLTLVNQSGSSSFKWLQNSFSTKNPHRQGITLALLLTKHFLSRRAYGACRVHGGGFAGTIQAFIPDGYLKEYVTFMESIFGVHSVTLLSVRPYGALYLNPLII